MSTGTGGAETIGRMLLRRADEQPDDDALIFPDARLSFAQLADEAVAIARGLHGMGVRPGAHVAVLMPNCPEFIASVFGIALAGAVSVPLNVRYRRRELAHVLGDSSTVLVLTSDRLAEHVDLVDLVAGASASLERPPPVVMFGGPAGPGIRHADDLLSAGHLVDRAVALAGGATDGHATAMVAYTSGTTSQPKGCELRHVGFTGHWPAVGARLDLRRGDRHWIPCPFFHMAGIGPVMASVHAGAASVSLQHLTVEAAYPQVRDEAVTHLHSAFPHITQTLLGHPSYWAGSLPALRVVLTVGAPAVQRRTQALLPPGAKLVSGYGMTEGTGLVAIGRISDPGDRRFETVGHPIEGVEIRTVDRERGGVLDPLDPRPGEIQFRGRPVMAGYLRDPENTADAVLPGGWVRSGDIGVLRVDGSLEYHGRVKDMLKVGGENVAAGEIEAHLSTHPAVRVAQVVGKPDPRHGEVPVAFVELVPGVEVSEDALIDWCRGEIASFKVPRAVRFVQEWPMSATKIQKGSLRESLAWEQPAG